MTIKNVPPDQKLLVKERANFCCEYCLSQEDFSPDTFSIEHITPRSKGGTNDLENLANSCQQCNSHKFTSTEVIDPLTGELVPLYNPRQNKWHHHFAWAEETTHVVGLTPIGRATVAKLRLNRTGVVNLRRVLSLTGFHPPTLDEGEF